MQTLRLSQSSLPDDRYRIELRLEGDGIAPHAARTDIACTLSEQDRDDLRWYLEDYPQFPFDQHPDIAAYIERRVEEIGATLFRHLFHATRNTRALWATLHAGLKDTRIEISTGVEGAGAIPWELLRDPETGIPLALSVQTFARAQSKTAQRPQLPRLSAGGPMRILFVICRPGRDDDAPFRSVARRLLEGLTEEQRTTYILDVLHPPTYDRLAEVLRRAKEARRPYHVVHFDGHGAYVEDFGGVVFDPSYFSDTRPGNHGYLVFEKPTTPENREFIPGPKLGALLRDTGVPVLVLNACRSAYAEISSPSPLPRVGEGIHEQVHTFGSLAQEVVDAGVAGVIAMPYHVFAITAARFLSELYGALAGGQSLGGAATYGRKRLHDDPHRDVVQPLTLQDWFVPVIYEAAPVCLFPERVAAPLHVALGATLHASQAGLDLNLLPPPITGFFGRDETLLMLDRAFDTENVILLHGYAGSGKTATAAEFARWYAFTGRLRTSDVPGTPDGSTGPVLFTSFEHYLPLPRALDQFGVVFDAMLQANGIHWLALDEDSRVQVALLLLQQVPVLWIWDNMESVIDSPPARVGVTHSQDASDAQSDVVEVRCTYTQAEQTALRDFLRACRGTKARVLLTSRRAEHPWLGDLSRYIPLPAMPYRERVHLARALARKYERDLDPLQAWEPLLDYTGGNPLILTMVVGQALRNGLQTHEQITAYITRLRDSEDAASDEAAEGRSRSLGASLAYSFDAAFTDEERRALALLHLFQGFTDAEALRIMTAPRSGDWGIPGMQNFDRQRWMKVLNRVAEIDLLAIHSEGYYTIHPAFAWFFRHLFEQYYSIQEAASKTKKVRGKRRKAGTPGSQSPLLVSSAVRAFVESMAALGDYYHNVYGRGNRDVIGTLRAEEANLLQAWRLAFRFAQDTPGIHRWRHCMISIMQGLRALYDHTGRRAGWRALVEAIEPEFVDVATGAPLLGRDDPWGLIMQYRVWLAEEVRDWAEAERLQQARVDWARKLAAPLLISSPGPLPADEKRETLDAAQRDTLRSLLISLHELGDIQREQGKAECVQAYEESLALSERIGERAGATICALNLGRAYTDLSVLRDLTAAERWYKRNLELADPRDHKGRAQTLTALGNVACEQFNDAKKRTGEPANLSRAKSRDQRDGEEASRELRGYLNDALSYYHQALDLLPADAVDDLITVCGQLGNIYVDAGDTERALQYWQQSVQYAEAAGNFDEAGRYRYNAAVGLAQQGRFADALAYARAALRDFRQCQGRAAAEEERTQYIIGEIAKAQRGQPSAFSAVVPGLN